MLKKAIIFSILIVCAVCAQAFNFDPITQEYSPSGKGSNHVFRVANPDTEKIAVKISVRPRFIEPDGVEIQGADSDLFLIYPRQIILNPGENRSIRVKWNGEAEPASELSFRIIAEQVPVAFTEVQPFEGAQLKLTYRYEGNIYVVPLGAKPNLKIKDFNRETINETVIETVTETVVEIVGEEEIEKQVEKEVETIVSKDVLVFKIENTGTRHTILNKFEVKLKRDENDSEPIILTDNQLKGVAGENILAGSIRMFSIPVPSGIWEGPIYGSIKQ
jgi:fimbrial chaperone protein